MSRIIFSVLVLALISQSLCHDKFLSTDLNMDIKPEVEFMKGLVNGIGYFNDLPNQEKCIEGDLDIVHDIQDIIKVVKDFNHDTDIKQAIQEVAERLEDIYQRAEVLGDNCKAYSKDLKTVAQQIKAFITADKYLTNALMHALGSLEDFNKIIHQMIAEFQDKDYYNAGEQVGSLVKLALLWDVKTNGLMMLQKLRFEPAEALAFAKGFNHGFGFFLDLHDESKCVVDSEAVVQDIMKIIDEFRDFDIKNITEIIKNVSAAVGDIMNLVEKGEGCQEFASEAKALLGKMKERFTSKTFYAELAWHVFSNYKQISSKMDASENDFSAGNYEKSGQEWGDFVKFVGFWNFKN